jgi:hypothetical protein
VLNDTLDDGFGRRYRALRPANGDKAVTSDTVTNTTGSRVFHDVKLALVTLILGSEMLFYNSRS